MNVKTKDSRREGRKRPPDFNQLLHSSQMQFWRVSDFSICLDFVTISKDLLVIFMF
jgi:hypothetical protein